MTVIVSNSKRFLHFVGIDVSKNKLDCAVMKGRTLLYHKEVPNTPDGVQAFINELKVLPDLSLNKTLIGFEQTGFYTSHLLNLLKKAKANVVLEDAVQIQNSLGRLRGKHDKIDSLRIGRYLYNNRSEIRLWEERRTVVDQLAHLATLRFRMLACYKSMKDPLKEQGGFLNKAITASHLEICNDSLEALKNDIGKVDQNILETVKSDDRIRRLYQIITSVPCIGPVTAVHIIVTTNEYKNITDPKKFASYAGVAPFRKESGGMVTKLKISHLANKRMKSLLHICAMSSVHAKGDLRDYFIRRTENDKKPKMSVLNAIRFKLILRVFTCLSQDRLYEKDYVRPLLNHS